MPQDYAKRAAQHKRQDRKPAKSPVSKTFVLLTLLAIAGFFAFLYYLTQIAPPQELAAPDSLSTSTLEKPQTGTEKQSVKKSGTDQPTEPEYDFYKLLPESEVIPPKVEEYQPRAVVQSQAKAFWLQAGSFRHFAEADRLKAQLTLQGLSVSVKQVKGSGGGDWYRVLAGPFTNRSELNRAQDILARANTESMLIEVK